MRKLAHGLDCGGPPARREQRPFKEIVTACVPEPASNMSKEGEREGGGAAIRTLIKHDRRWRKEGRKEGGVGVAGRGDWLNSRRGKWAD